MLPDKDNVQCAVDLRPRHEGIDFFLFFEKHFHFDVIDCARVTLSFLLSRTSVNTRTL